MAPTHSKFRVTEVRAFKIAPFEKRIQYVVVYEGNDGKVQPSPQPLEDLIDCPLLMFDFEVRRFREFQKSCGKGTKQKLGGRLKKPFPPNWMSVLNCDRSKEYVPTGRERLEKIKSSKILVVNEDADEFYEVTFEFQTTPRFVRRAFMEFYYPVDLLCYWKEKGLNGPEHCCTLNEAERIGRGRKLKQKRKFSKKIKTLKRAPRKQTLLRLRSQTGYAGRPRRDALRMPLRT